MERTEYYQVARYSEELGIWVRVEDEITAWADAARVYDTAKARRPNRRLRITHHVTTVEVVQEDEA